MSNFSENIKYLRNKRGLSQETMAAQLGVTRSKIASYEDGRAEPSIETLIKYTDFFKLPIDAMLKNDLTTSWEGTFIDIGPNRVLFPVLMTEDNENVIEVVQYKASAGYLSGYSDPEYISRLPRMQLPFIPTGKHRAFPIKGDSMEPFVRDGAFVVGKYIENTSDIRNGQTYIVVTKDDGLSYKRVFTDKIKEGTLLLQSDNGFYKPYEVHLSNVMEMWEYACKIDVQAYQKEELKLESILQMMRGFQIELEQIKGKIVN